MSSGSQRFQHGLDVYDGMTANAFDSRLNPGLAALEPQLPQHVGYALNLGVSGDDLREMVYLTSVTAGDTRHRDGLAKVAELKGVDHVDIAGHTALGPLERAFPFLVDSVIDYTMGAEWARAVLDGPTRQIAAVGSCAVLGDAWPQMRRHVAHALQLGVSRKTLSEVINILTVAVGFPIALNAADEMRTVFDEEDQQ